MKYKSHAGINDFKRNLSSILGKLDAQQTTPFLVSSPRKCRAGINVFDSLKFTYKVGHEFLTPGQTCKNLFLLNLEDGCGRVYDGIFSGTKEAQRQLTGSIDGWWSRNYFVSLMRFIDMFKNVLTFCDVHLLALDLYSVQAFSRHYAVMEQFDDCMAFLLRVGYLGM